MESTIEEKEEKFRLWATIGAVLIIVATFFPYRGDSLEHIWDFWMNGYLMTIFARIIVRALCVIVLICIRKFEKKALANTMLVFGGLFVLYTLGHGLGILNFQWDLVGIDGPMGIVTEGSSVLLLGFWMMLLGSIAILVAGICMYRLIAKREKKIDAQIKDQ